MATATPEDPYKTGTRSGLTPDELSGLEGMQQRYNLATPEQRADDYVGKNPNISVNGGLTPEQLGQYYAKYGVPIKAGGSGDSAAASELDSVKRADDQHSDASTLNNLKQGFANTQDANKQFGALPGRAAYGNPIKRFFWASNKRKAATLGGASGALATAVTILSFLGFSTGPLEFVHIAKLLTGPLSTLGHVNLASDYRMGKLLYQIYKNGDISNLDAGDTRLGPVTRFLKKPVMQALTDRGIEPQYGTLKTFDGFTVDITNPKSPYYGKSPDDALKAIKTDLNSDKLSFKWADAEQTKILVSGEGFNGDTAAVKATSALVAKTYNNWLFGKVASAINSHFFFKYSEASGNVFHYLNKLQVQKTQQILDALKAWWTNRNTQLKDGVDPSTIDASNAEMKTQTTDNNGKPVTDTTAAPGESGPVTAQGIRAKLLELPGAKPGLTAAGAIATLVGLICLLQAIDRGIGFVQWVQVKLPAMREALYAISVGSQIMTGQDVDMNEVNQLASQFNSYDATTHKVTSSWSDAAPIESMGGGTGGTDMTPEMKGMFIGGAPAILKWTESGAVTSLCSTAVQVAVGVGSVVVGIFSGGLFSTVAGVAAGYFVAPHIVDFISNLLAGNAIDPANLSGAQWGNVIAYGAQLAGNSQALQYGGTQLNSQQVAQLNASAEAQSQSEFHSESLADRIFNPYDYRSVVGGTIDQMNIAGGPQGVMATITNLPALLGSIIKMPLSLFGAITHAANQPYQYPFPEYGFSNADLTNPAVDDPVANAKVVGNLLDNNNTNGEPDYINLALDCFGVSVTKGTDGWDAVPSTDSPTDDAFKQDRTYGVNAYDTATYDPTTCVKNNDLNWLRFRMWIYDTRLANGYACYMGDGTSCANDNVGGGTPNTTASGNGNNLIWLYSGADGGEFAGVADGGKDPVLGVSSFWMSGQCSQASLAEVLNAYHMGQKLASTGVAGKGGVGPSTTGSDPLYKIIDVERASYKAGVWNGAFDFTAASPKQTPDVQAAVSNIMRSWQIEADMFQMNLTYYSTDSNNTQYHIDDTRASLDKFISMAQSGTPVITNGPNHWLVIVGGDANNVYLLDSSGHNYTWANQATKDSVNLYNPNLTVKVPRDQFISGLDSAQYKNYWGADINGNNPAPIAVVLTPKQ